MVSDGKISEVEDKLLEACERMMDAHGGKEKGGSGRVEGFGCCCCAVDREAVSGAQSSDGEAGLAGSGEQRCPDELGVSVGQRASLGIKAP